MNLIYVDEGYMEYVDGLQTKRLMTRFITPGDTAVWVEYCEDPLATRFTAIAGKTPAEMAQYVVELTMKRYAEQRLGLQALIDKETGAFVGQCGLFVKEVNGEREIEVGYHLLRKHWGKGYATEAAQLFRDYGFENDVAGSIVSFIDPLNFPSKNVALRNGMKLSEKKADFGGKPHDIFRITRKEWLTLKEGG